MIVSEDKWKKESMILPSLRVKEIAEQKGIGINKLSRLADVNIKTIRRLFHDPHYSPTLDTLGKIAKALEVKTTELIVDDEEPQGDGKQ